MNLIKSTAILVFLITTCLYSQVLEKPPATAKFQLHLKPLTLTYKDFIKELQYSMDYINEVDNLDTIKNLEMGIIFDSNSYEDGFIENNYITFTNIDYDTIKDSVPKESYSIKFIYPITFSEITNIIEISGDTLSYPISGNFLSGPDIDYSILKGKNISSVQISFDGFERVIRVTGSSKKIIQGLAESLSLHFSKYEQHSHWYITLIIISVFLFIIFIFKTAKDKNTLKFHIKFSKLESNVFVIIIMLITFLIILIPNIIFSYNPEFQIQFPSQTWFEKNSAYIYQIGIALITIIISIFSQPILLFIKKTSNNLYLKIKDSNISN